MVKSTLASHRDYRHWPPYRNKWRRWLNHTAAFLRWGSHRIGVPHMRRSARLPYCPGHGRDRSFHLRWDQTRYTTEVRVYACLGRSAHGALYGYVGWSSDCFQRNGSMVWSSCFVGVGSNGLYRARDESPNYNDCLASKGKNYA